MLEDMIEQRESAAHVIRDAARCLVNLTLLAILYD